MFSPNFQQFIFISQLFSDILKLNNSTNLVKLRSLFYSNFLSYSKNRIKVAIFSTLENSADPQSKDELELDTESIFAKYHMSISVL